MLGKGGISVSQTSIFKHFTLQLQFVHISPKLEYQTDFGLEQVTPSEACRDWISTYIRPNCKLVRGQYMLHCLTVSHFGLEQVTPL